MNVYKIRDKETGLFSTGGMDPTFTKKGKVWTGIGPLKAHITMHRRHVLTEEELAQMRWGCRLHDISKDYLQDIEIIEYDFSTGTERVITV
jgi:hypothetical protein